MPFNDNITDLMLDNDKSDHDPLMLNNELFGLKEMNESPRLGGDLLGAGESIDGLSNNLLMDTNFDDD